RRGRAGHEVRAAERDRLPVLLELIVAQGERLRAHHAADQLLEAAPLDVRSGVKVAVQGAGRLAVPALQLLHDAAGVRALAYRRRAERAADRLARRARVALPAGLAVAQVPDV